MVTIIQKVIGGILAGSAGLVIINYDLASSSYFWIYWVRNVTYINEHVSHDYIL